MSNAIIASRNKREGAYAGKRVSGGRNSLNWQCRPISHERVGGHPHVKKAISLRCWQQLRKGRP